MIRRDNIADVICIGAQKSSTSWLHNILSIHPDVHVFPNSTPLTSTNKEVHFWDWNRHRGIDWYRDLMTPPRAGMKTLDFTPEYAFLPEKHIDECLKLNPTAKIIYCLRDPLARAISALRMHMMWRNEASGERDPHIAYNQEFLSLINDAKLKRHGAYARNHAAWVKRYPNVFVLNYEDVLTSGETVYGRLMDFLDLDADRMDKEQSEELRKRLNRRIWVSKKYPVDPAVTHFLMGYTMEARNACRSYFGIEFEEYKDFI